MSTTVTQRAITPSWLTVASFSLLFSVVSGIVVAAVDYGKQETENASLEQRVKDYQTANDQIAAKLDQWSKAYGTQEQALRTAQQQVSDLQNDRCNKVKSDVDDIRSQISLEEKWNYPAEVIERHGRLMDEYQQTLRTCYASSGHA